MTYNSWDYTPSSHYVKYNLKEEKIREVPTLTNSKTEDDNLNIYIKTEKFVKTKDPRIWGPPTWLYFHLMSANYPIKPTREEMVGMRNFIISIPYTLPCESCKDHAKKFIFDRSDFLNIIVLNRDNLFNFFVDFHNYVNKRQGKNEMTYEEARKKYIGVGVDLNRLYY